MLAGRSGLKRRRQSFSLAITVVLVCSFFLSPQIGLLSAQSTYDSRWDGSVSDMLECIQQNKNSWDQNIFTLPGDEAKYHLFINTIQTVEQIRNNYETNQPDLSMVQNVNVAKEVLLDVAKYFSDVEINTKTFQFLSEANIISLGEELKSLGVNFNIAEVFCHI
jgi:hypothetical protein